MRIQSLLFIIYTLSFLNSCQIEEKITPLSESISLAELQRERLVKAVENEGRSALTASIVSGVEFGEDNVYYLNLRYSVEDLDIFKMAEMSNKFEEIASSFLGVVANILLSIGGPQEIELDEFIVDLPELDIDYSIVKSVRVEEVYIQYADDVQLSSGFDADFSYIEGLDIVETIDSPWLGTVDSLIFGYNKVRNDCFQKCLLFQIYNRNILDVIKNRDTIALKPILTLNSLPEYTDLKIKGHVVLQIGLKLPF